ncbi:MAG: AGE family epimerase/isomerase [Streptosporangiaceae bacterium]|jgi:mannose/cellobiose epimerase-like protein (N-acyl-D-glucosamine 2-epimerase family)
MAAGALHRRTGEERFAASAARWWAEIDRYYLDRENGGGWQELAPDMTPAASLRSGKPDLCHCYPGRPARVPAAEPDPATALARRGPGAAACPVP